MSTYGTIQNTYDDSCSEDAFSMVSSVVNIVQIGIKHHVLRNVLMSIAVHVRMLLFYIGCFTWISTHSTSSCFLSYIL